MAPDAAGLLIASAAVDRMERDQMYVLIQKLEERFNQDITSSYPGNRCGDFLDADPNKLPTEVCPPIIAAATKIALELLEKTGFMGIRVQAATVHSFLPWVTLLEKISRNA